MWLLINGNSVPNNRSNPYDGPSHFTFQGALAVDSTFVAPPYDPAPTVNCKANCSVTGTTFLPVDQAQWPAAAQSIVAHAGLTEG